MATAWHVGVTSDPEGSNETQPIEKFESLEKAKARVFDIITNASPAKIDYSKTRMYECFHVEPIEPAPGVWDGFYVFIFGSAF